jgi:hypothetical protein
VGLRLEVKGGVEVQNSLLQIWSGKNAREWKERKRTKCKITPSFPTSVGSISFVSGTISMPKRVINNVVRTGAEQN